MVLASLASKVAGSGHSPGHALSPALGDTYAVRLRNVTYGADANSEAGDHLFKAIALDSGLLKSARFGIDAAGKTEGD